MKVVIRGYGPAQDTLDQLAWRLASFVGMFVVAPVLLAVGITWGIWIAKQ